MKAKATTTTAKMQVIFVPVNKILPDPKNPRHTINEKADLELAASIEQYGVQQPITVRPCTDDKRFDYYAVIGHRRLRASKIAMLREIPVIVRDFSNEEALEVQILENLQREDFSPIDEAHAFNTLLKKESLDWLCAKIHKSKKYVSDRLKLLALHPIGQKLLELNKLPLSHALLISKLQTMEEQETVMRKLFPCSDIQYNNPSYDEGFADLICELTYDELRHAVDRTFVDMSDAAFDTADDKLIAERGGCISCEYRTQNAMLLFEDITDEDRCTNVACFKLKTTAHLKQAEEKAKEHYGERIKHAAINTMNSRTVTVAGAKMEYSEKPADGLTPVIIAKTDNYKPQVLGNIVYVDMKDAEKKKEPRKNADDSLLEEVKRFEENELANMQAIVAYLDNNMVNTDKLMKLHLAQALSNVNLRNMALLSRMMGCSVAPETEEVMKWETTLSWNQKQEYQSELIKGIVKHMSSSDIIHLIIIANTIDEFNDLDDATDDDYLEEDITLKKYFKLIGYKPAKASAV